MTLPMPGLRTIGATAAAITLALSSPGQSAELAVTLHAAGGAAVALQSPPAAVLADSLDRLIHRANIAGDAGALAVIRAQAQRALAGYPEHPVLTVRLAQTYHREAALRMGTESKVAQSLLSSAQTLLERAAKRSDALPETHALLASVIGMRITNMALGIALGGRADAAMQRALKAGPENPRVWLAHGIATLHKPGFAGGGVTAAIEQLQRAEALFQQEAQRTAGTVNGAAEALAWLGIAYTRAKRREDAARAYAAALALEPDYVWVRDILLPAL